ncbi:hypothetical protein [Cellulosimicrobium protaetiae]|uniref:Uncharacterized protein n=1 Tax=Cellulosimicrobium protaetiae TaxID=2587808 RepID=A0A6M5ULX5_9MICO|nr:hypothetical protein [Cellulosimicrobium protaetiae]QJW37849.1 hypothetical protein FIC82_018415 [Cellulosimicrobium protaetiae]
MTSRTTTATSTLLAALGVAALAAGCGAAPAPDAEPAVDAPTARAAHDSAAPPAEQHLVVVSGSEVDLDGETVEPTSREVRPEIAWDGDRVAFLSGATLVDGDVDPASCADRIVGLEATQGDTRDVPGSSLPATLLDDGAQVCVRTDEGVVLHVELRGPDVRDELQVSVRAQLPR